MTSFSAHPVAILRAGSPSALVRSPILSVCWRNDWLGRSFIRSFVSIPACGDDGRHWRVSLLDGEKQRVRARGGALSTISYGGNLL